jgi:hypothetical protein
MLKMNYETLRAEMARSFAIIPAGYEADPVMMIQSRGAEVNADLAIFALKEMERGLAEKGDPLDLVAAIMAVCGGVIINTSERLASSSDNKDRAAVKEYVLNYALSSLAKMFSGIGTIEDDKVEFLPHLKDVGDA